MDDDLIMIDLLSEREQRSYRHRADTKSQMEEAARAGVQKENLREADIEVNSKMAADFSSRTFLTPELRIQRRLFLRMVGGGS